MLKFLDTIGIVTVSSLPISGEEGEVVYYDGDFYGWTDSTWKSLNNDATTKADVGLGNVDNTSDLNKPTFVGATSMAGGVKGYVPAPSAGDQGKVLSGAGTWISVATSAATTTFSPYGNLTATDVQDALQELDDEKVKIGTVVSSGLTMATARILGRTSASTGAIQELSAATVTAFLDTFTTSNKGLVPAPGSTSGKYLRDDGTWDAISIASGWVPVTATGTGASQDITLPESGLSEHNVMVFVNGTRWNISEYSISGDVLTLTTNASGDSIEILKPAGSDGAPGPAAAWGLIPGDIADQTDLQEVLDGKANLNGADFSGTLTFDGDNVFHEGNLAFGTGLSFSGGSLFITPTSWASSVTATGTGSSQGITLPESGLTPKQVLVFVNGVRWETSEYSITGTTLTLTTNSSGDTVEIVKPVGASAYTPSAVSSQSTNYIAVLADANTYVRFTGGSPTTFTIPPHGTIAYAIGTEIEVEQAGTGVVTFTPGSGVTINSRGARYDTNGQYAVATIKKVATNTWTVYGDLA